MAKTKEIVKPCGFECAQRRRKCYRNKQHEIRAGEYCLVFTGNMSSKGYCLDCAAVILQKGNARIAKLIDDLENMTKKN